MSGSVEKGSRSQAIGGPVHVAILGPHKCVRTYVSAPAGRTGISSVSKCRRLSSRVTLKSSVRRSQRSTLGLVSTKLRTSVTVDVNSPTRSPSAVRDGGRLVSVLLVHTKGKRIRLPGLPIFLLTLPRLHDPGSFRSDRIRLLWTPLGRLRPFSSDKGLSSLPNCRGTIERNRNP